MGGIGSGRPSSYITADKCEDYHSIDLAWLRRKKAFFTGNSGNITWSRNGRETGSIKYQMEAGGLRLIYRSRRPGEDWEQINEVIPFARTGTNFEGQRLWFLCPSCHRRCRVLYGGRQFRCRCCHRLKYESQYECGISRSTSQRHKLRDRLGRSGSIDDPFPAKPKGMHWQTYERLEARDRALEERWAGDVVAWLQKRRR